jgi:phospholipid-binding lipoprotein MlaA
VTSSIIFVARALRCGIVRLVVTGALAGLGGCATGPNANPRDPLEPLNRSVMQFNEGVDAVALKPLATIYRQVLPPLVRTGVSNFFGNLSDPWSSVNSALQFKFRDAAENIIRFGINTVFGLGGVLDIASELSIERHREDFGQTLGRWGVPAGPYLVLPLLGPSTVRDTAALGLDFNVDPVHWVDPWQARYALYILRAVDVRSNLLRAGSVLDEAALDKYSFFRDAHLQRRRANIFENNKSRDDDKGGQEPKADGEPAPGDGGKIPPEPSPDAGKLPPEPPDEVSPAAPAIPPAGK